MKKLTLIPILLCLAFYVSAQDFKAIISNISDGNIELLRGQFDELVDFCFENDQDLLEQDELIDRVKTTIANIKPSASELIHIADSKDNGSKYAVAKITSQKGEYRLFVYTEGDKIIELRFNKE